MLFQHESLHLHRGLLRHVRGGLFALVLIGAAATVHADHELSWSGCILDDIHCQDNDAETYAIYVPSTYTPDRAWPIVYCFDAAARGRLPVERLRRAAEAHGYIVVGSNNSRNGDWQPIADAANAMMRDTAQRFPLDHRRLYAAGFSGGARVACALATVGKFAGVIACSGGFTNGAVPAEVPFAFFGTAGREDFNFEELYRLGPELDRRGAPNRLAIVAGGHEWASEAVMEEALAWFDLQAIRRGVRDRDSSWIQSQYALRTAAADTLKEAPDEQARGYHAIIADFEGLLDTAEIRKKVAELEKSRAYQRAVAKRERSFRDEADWRSELLQAAAPAADPSQPEDPFGALNQPREDTPRFGPGDPMDAERRANTALSRPPRTVFGLEREEPFDKLRRLAAHLRRRCAKEPAASRALSGAFMTCMSDGNALMEQHNPAAAARAFEAATVIHPDAPGGWLTLAEAQLAAGNRRAAREALQAALAKGAPSTPQLEALRARLDPAAAAAEPASAGMSNLHVTIPLPKIRSPAPTPPKRIDRSPEQPGTSSTMKRADEAQPAAETSPAASNSVSGSDTILRQPIRVAATPFTSFGMSLEVSGRSSTRQITRIVVREVAPNSDAAEQGIRVGDEIVRIDGRTIYSFTADFDRNSDFGQYFVARNTGDRITLVIASPNGEQREVTLTEGLVVRAPFSSPWR